MPREGFESGSGAERAKRVNGSDRGSNPVVPSGRAVPREGFESGSGAERAKRVNGSDRGSNPVAPSGRDRPTLAWIPPGPLFRREQRRERQSRAVATAPCRCDGPVPFDGPVPLRPRVGTAKRVGQSTRIRSPLRTGMTLNEVKKCVSRDGPESGPKRRSECGSRRRTGAGSIAPETDAGRIVSVTRSVTRFVGTSLTSRRPCHPCRPCRRPCHRRRRGRPRARRHRRRSRRPSGHRPR